MNGDFGPTDRQLRPSEREDMPLLRRGGGGNEVDGLMTFCHDARKGRNIGSHWPNQVRASALLDQYDQRLGGLRNALGGSRHHQAAPLVKVRRACHIVRPVERQIL